MHSYTSYAIDDLRLLAITKQFTKNITLTSITSTLRTHKVNLRILHTHTLRTYTHYETYTQNARTHTYIGCAHIGSWDICSYSPDINTLKRKNWTCWHDIHPPPEKKNLLWAERGKPRSLEQKGMAVSSDEGRTKNLLSVSGDEGHLLVGIHNLQRAHIFTSETETWKKGKW